MSNLKQIFNLFISEVANSTNLRVAKVVKVAKRHGATDQEIANELGITRQAVNLLFQKYINKKGGVRI